LSKAPKKVRDKWRSKNWYSVYTPSYFGELNVAQIPCDDQSKLMGRVVENTLYDITGDFAHQSTKLYFLVIGVEGDKAQTTLKGHEYSADYLRSLVRRGSSRVDCIAEVATKDKFSTVVSAVAFARARLNASQQHAIRLVMRRIFEEKAKNLTYDQLSQEIVLGKVGSDIYNEAKKIAPLRHVGVRKSKLTKLSPELEERIMQVKKN